ncbi:hypothetical protein ONZ51_g5942 [Trametes cubensis]|uniref:Uncharacterized protein n=1 Tax=Trametes cubensis TaxID=1111947 RepID=A0AAD7TT32_9APHY|nr:hypothetical protein ONZ51_g5942 [Trametes cubensis]
MSTATLPPVPKSPSVGARRKGPKSLPKLPMSAFTPPNTGTSDKFPLAPSPSSLQPTEVIDAHVIAPKGDLSSWKSQVGQNLGGRLRGLVLSLHGVQPEEVEKVVQESLTLAPLHSSRVQASASTSSTPVLAIAVPFVLEDGVPSSPPSYLTNASSSKPSIVLSTTFKQSSPAAIEALAWALTQGYTVNIDVQCDLAHEANWDALEDLLTKATQSPESAKGKIILSHLRPLYMLLRRPLKHEALISFPCSRPCSEPPPAARQPRAADREAPHARALPELPVAHRLTLALREPLHQLPPARVGRAHPADAPPPPSDANEEEKEKAARLESKEAKEWKRRIKMYIGHAVEAFGFQRILFGSSPAAPLTASTPASNAGHWYELARESFAELGIEQEAIDAVFALNARQVYES